MKLVQLLGSRPALNGRGHKVDTGLYHCPACGADVELPLSVGRNDKTCGCCKGADHRAHTIFRPAPAERTCLMCGKRFMSRGAGNRRCGRCAHLVEWSRGTEYYMPPVHRMSQDKSTVACCLET